MMEEHQPVGGSSSPSLVGGARNETLLDPRALQILSTEHWSLIAARSLAYNEAFSRAAMFLAFLSASLIVIGFLLASDSVHAVVTPVAALLLGADAFIGLATVGRLMGSGGEEVHAIRGMNRIRHAYVEILPGIEPYFVSGLHDDLRGVLATYGSPPTSGSSLGNLLHGLTTTLGMIGTIDAILVGALWSVVGLGLGVDARVAVISGVAAATVWFLALFVAVARMIISRQIKAPALFPSPE